MCTLIRISETTSGCGFNAHLPCRSGLSHNCIMPIMASAAAQISDVKNAHVQSNVCTNGYSGLEHRTNQDTNEEVQSNSRLCLLCVFSIICYPFLCYPNFLTSVNCVTIDISSSISLASEVYTLATQRFSMSLELLTHATNRQYM